MDTELHDALDRSFGDGPPPAPAALLVDAGHRRLRRRRLAEGATALVVAAVAVTGAVLASGDATERAAPPVAGSPSASPSATPVPQPYDVVTDGTVTVDQDAALDDDGLVRIPPGTEVTRLLPNPYDVEEPARSVAAILVRGDRAVWWASYANGGPVQFTTSTEAQWDTAFDDWVQEQRSMIGGDGTVAPPEPGDDWPGLDDDTLVRFADGEVLEALTGARIVEQRAHPKVGESFAGPADRSAAAVVRRDGRRYYVLARAVVEGPPQYIAVRGVDGGATLEEFLDLARARYDEGGGGLL